MWFVTFASYSLAFWYGVTLVLESREEEFPEYTPGSMAIVKKLDFATRPQNS
jgi:hypothetical protein